MLCCPTSSKLLVILGQMYFHFALGPANSWSCPEKASSCLYAPATPAMPATGYLLFIEGRGCSENLDQIQLGQSCLVASGCVGCGGVMVRVLPSWGAETRTVHSNVSEEKI